MEIQASELEKVRRSKPDLTHLDPLSTEVRTWLDRTYDAVRKVDRAEAVVLKLHEQYLTDSARKSIASAEIAKTVDRAVTTT